MENGRKEKINSRTANPYELNKLLVSPPRAWNRVHSEQHFTAVSPLRAWDRVIIYHSYLKVSMFLPCVRGLET